MGSLSRTESFTAPSCPLKGPAFFSSLVRVGCSHVPEHVSSFLPLGPSTCVKYLSFCPQLSIPSSPSMEMGCTAPAEFMSLCIVYPPLCPYVSDSACNEEGDAHSGSVMLLWPSAGSVALTLRPTAGNTASCLLLAQFFLCCRQNVLSCCRLINCVPFNSCSCTKCVCSRPMDDSSPS